MFTLRIDLQEGFDNDTVRVSVNGSEVYNNSAVKTRLPVGVAESFEIQLDRDSAHVEVNVPSQNCSGEVDLRPSEFPYLAVTLTRDRQLKFERSKELFRYL